MRLRLRGPNGTAALQLADNATIADLLSHISAETGLLAYDIRYGYPPQLLSLESKPQSTLLSDLDITLNDEQLIIGARYIDPIDQPLTAISGQSSGAFEPASSKKIALKKQATLMEVPELRLPDRSEILSTYQSC